MPPVNRTDRRERDTQVQNRDRRDHKAQAEPNPAGHGVVVVPSPVEDSHAKVRDELNTIAGERGTQYDVEMVPRVVLREIAARVEALGRVEEKKAAVIEAAKAVAFIEGGIRWPSEEDVEKFLRLFEAASALVESESASKKEDAVE